MSSVKKSKRTKIQKPLTDLQFVILQAAVTLVKNEQIKRLSALRARLRQVFPDKPKNIERALTYWANYLVSKGNQ